VKRVIIVQARLGSTRLPGKVLMDLAGRPMLAQQIVRLRRCRQAEAIVIATTTNPLDDPIVALAEAEGLACYRGSEQDVLSRYVEAARMVRAEIVVRVTADCPLIDAAVTDHVVEILTAGPESCDYATNTLERTYPRGLDVEALTMEALERCHRLATTEQDREHVTSLIRRSAGDQFRVVSVKDAHDNSDLRWTVDTQADMDLMRRIYAGLDLGRECKAYPEILVWVRSHPGLSDANAGVETWDPISKPPKHRH